MLKILEAMIIFLGGHLLNEVEANPRGMNGIDLILSKSRVIAIFFVAAITLPLLFVSGIVLAMVGVSHWAGDPESVATFHFFVYLGGSLSTVSALLAGFGLSKKRFEIAPEKKAEAPTPETHATQVIERVVVNVIKEFMKEPKTSKTAASLSPSLPTSTPPA